MLQSVIDIQREAVSKLFSVLQTKPNKNIFFKAPTGSGKTYMMADFMNQHLSKYPDTVFIVSTLSKGGLAEQNYQQFKKYVDARMFKNLNPYLINSESTSEERLYIPIDKNVYILPRDLYKDKSKLKQGSMDLFLNSVTKGDILRSVPGRRIILIKDECHIATKNLDEIESYFSRVINFSATPNLVRGQFPDVAISEEEAIQAKLIKSVEYVEYDSDNEEISLDKALDEFEKIKVEYNNTLGINPCMIIQISNKERAQEEWEIIQRVLNNIKHHDLKWMLIVDKSGQEDSLQCDTNDSIKAKKLPVTKWKDFAKEESSTIDVIIFKMVISEGWDIPRACMLYQMRDSKSKQLDEQVIGRVRRNPKLLTFETLAVRDQEFLMKAKVWGIKENSKTTTVSVHLQKKPKEIQDELKIKTTVLQGLTQSEVNDVNSILKCKKPSIIGESIFDSYDKIKGINANLKEFYDTQISSLSDWYKFVDNFSEIKKKIDNLSCDYDTNMKIRTDEQGNEIFSSPSEISWYVENKEYPCDVRRSIWAKADVDDDEFTFDSKAEVEWMKNLLDMMNTNSNKPACRLIKALSDEEDIFLFGKNYLPDSDIKFEYYLDGVHSSYPDFIMKDSFDRIHLFEIKSVNSSNALNIDSDEYEEKIRALKDSYKYASKLVHYHFWIPIQDGKNWNIYHLHDGNEELVSYKQCVSFIKSEPSASSVKTTSS